MKVKTTWIADDGEEYLTEKAAIQADKKVAENATIWLEESDPCWTLQVWKEFIQKQIDQYGPRSVLSTDAGYNNVSIQIEVRP